MLEYIPNDSIDIKTPYNVALRAFYKRSFAYKTVKTRLPVIMQQVIEVLVNNEELILKDYGTVAKEDFRKIIVELNNLKDEIDVNKPLACIKSKRNDAIIYNDYLNRQNALDGVATYVTGTFLHAECYVYRRIWEIVENTNIMKTLDPFQITKRKCFNESIAMFLDIAPFVMDILQQEQCSSNRENFINLLKMNLWGNKYDLSLSLGVFERTDNQLEFIKSLESNILCDHSEELWRLISDCGNVKKSKIVDLILDNAGYELFTDFCLADFLTTKKFATKIRFYVKELPWFISDTTTIDLKWTLEQLLMNDNEILRMMSERWKNYFDNNTWTIEEHDYWTLPFDYTTMKINDRKLYDKLSESILIIFKGDLNYRKLFGDLHWDPVTTVKEALQGYHPTNICALRTLKSDIICGLVDGLAEKMEQIQSDWMNTGTYGVIQFCNYVEITSNKS